jgi:hypothetical protein
MAEKVRGKKKVASAQSESPMNRKSHRFSGGAFRTPNGPKSEWWSRFRIVAWAEERRVESPVFFSSAPNRENQEGIFNSQTKVWTRHGKAVILLVVTFINWVLIWRLSHRCVVVCGWFMSLGGESQIRQTPGHESNHCRWTHPSYLAVAAYVLYRRGQW